MLPPPPLPAASATVRPRSLRLGFLALTDAAPFAVAEHLGFFSKHGLRVELRREIGWATIREKIIYGELDAAQAPAPMLWSTQLGLGCPPCDVLTALVLNVHGNALTLSRALWGAGVRDAASLRAHAKDRRARQPLTLGIVFQFSSHHLLLRDWLLAANINPERDVRIVVVPPAQMFRNLAAGTIDGYCAGEPWNTLAVHEGAGWRPAWSAAQSPGHLEKVLMVTPRFAEKNPPHTTPSSPPSPPPAPGATNPSTASPSRSSSLARPTLISPPASSRPPSSAASSAATAGSKTSPTFTSFTAARPTSPPPTKPRHSSTPSAPPASSPPPPQPTPRYPPASFAKTCIAPLWPPPPE